MENYDFFVKLMPFSELYEGDNEIYVYGWCTELECVECPVREECNGVFKTKMPRLEKSEFDNFKEQYPEFFI